MEASMQGIFAGCFSQYAQGKRLALRDHKAARAIIQCRTSALGGHLQRCPDGHVSRIQYHSCRHRSCPRCSALPKARWAEAQQARLLACDHYHVVFTLPHELLELWLLNRSWFIDALFQASRDTLMSLLREGRYLKAEPGIVMSLHTWGRTLSLHPHIHCLVSGGGLDASGSWTPVKNGYLLPVRVVKALYRGKLLARLWAALRGARLKLPEGMDAAGLSRLLKVLGRKDWNVRLQERYAHGRGVMRYLARYVKGGPISDRRLVAVTPQRVCFRYTDHRDGKRKRMELSTDHFIQRVLWHVPEAGQHTIRHYGLYSHKARARRALIRAHLGQAPETESVAPLDWQQFMEDSGGKDKGQCPVCGKRLQALLPFGAKQHTNSIGPIQRCAHVQQGVEVDAPTRYLERDPPT